MSIVWLVLGAAMLSCGPPCQDARCSIRPSEAARRRSASVARPPDEPPPGVVAAAPPAAKVAPPEPAPVVREAPVTLAADVGQLELMPPADLVVNIVRLTAPEIDAPCKIEVDGAGYIARNRGTRTMRIYQYRLQRGADGFVSAQGSSNNYPPDQGMAISFDFRADPDLGQRHGVYRAIIVCVDLEGWGDPTKLAYTAAGKQVNAMLEALRARFVREGIAE